MGNNKTITDFQSFFLLYQKHVNWRKLTFAKGIFQFYPEHPEEEEEKKKKTKQPTSQLSLLQTALYLTDEHFNTVESKKKKKTNPKFEYLELSYHRIPNS